MIFDAYLESPILSSIMQQPDIDFRIWSDDRNVFLDVAILFRSTLATVSTRRFVLRQYGEQYAPLGQNVPASVSADIARTKSHVLLAFNCATTNVVISKDILIRKP